ncbi:MAG: hypothetical protein ACPGN3_15670 [Opitutales bacterium]
MSTAKEENNECCGAEAEEPKKEGFFGRMLNKIDEKMKAKAEEQSENSCCGSDSDGKGGGCC